MTNFVTFLPIFGELKMMVCGFDSMP